VASPGASTGAAPSILQQDRYRKLKGLLRGADSLVDTAVYFPTSSHRLENTSEKYWGNLPDRFWNGCSGLRPYCDYDVVDEPLIGDGALETYRQLIIFEAEVAENTTLKIMTGWIRRGGTVIIAATGTMQTVEGDPEPFLRLSGMGREKYITGRAEDLSLAMHSAMPHLHAQDLAVIPSGWQKPDAAVKPLAMRGTTVVAWERAWGAGSVFALSDGASCLPVMLDFFLWYSHDRQLPYRGGGSLSVTTRGHGGLCDPFRGRYCPVESERRAGRGPDRIPTLDHPRVGPVLDPGQPSPSPDRTALRINPWTTAAEAQTKPSPFPEVHRVTPHGLTRHLRLPSEATTCSPSRSEVCYAALARWSPSLDPARDRRNDLRRSLDRPVDRQERLPW